MGDDEQQPALQRAIEAYNTARQMALDFNQPAAMRQAHEDEMMRAAADIIELLD